MTFEESVNRRERTITDLLGFAGRLQYGEQRRQHGDAGDISDQHPNAGNLAEFGNPPIVCRKKRQETGCYRGGSECQRGADLLCSAHQRRPKLTDFVTLGSIPNRKLNPEVDTEPDEKHRKRNGDEI